MSFFNIHFYTCILSLVLMGASISRAQVGHASGLRCLEIFSPASASNASSPEVFRYPYRSALTAHRLDPRAGQFLGEGASAVALLIDDPRNPGQPIVQKRYHHDSHGTNRFESDTEGLRRFHQILGDQPQTDFLIVSAVQVIERPTMLGMEPQLLAYMPFIEGRTVHDLVLDTTIPQTLRDEVTRIYLEKMNSLERRLIAAGAVSGQIARRDGQARHFADGRLDGLPMLSGRFTGRGVLFLIKADNVIVDPIDISRMTMVDPY